MAILVDLRQQMGRELGVSLTIPNADFTAAAATSITAANTLRNSLWGTTKFSDMGTGIFRPTAASAADYFRFAGDLANTTGVLSHTGANYADTTPGSEIPELWYWNVRPEREIIDSLNRVSKFSYVTSHHLLSHGSRFDYSMDIDALDVNWTDVLTPTTSAKIATLNQITPYGPRGYRLVNDAANEGTRPSFIRVSQGRYASAFAIVTTTVGTASFQMYDGTNSANIGTAVTHSETHSMLVCIRNQQLPATCKAVSLSMLGTTSTSDILWNQVGLYIHDDLLVQLPSFINESFMAPRFFQMQPKVQIATDVYDATSLEPVPLVEGVDYWPVFNHYDAEPYKVRFASNRLYQWPIMVEYRRPISDFTTFAADDTATTAMPVHELMPRWKIDLLETVYDGTVYRHPQWAEKMAVAQRELATALASRPRKSISRAKPWYVGVSRQ